jgi:uncharacterized SAM-binding protein YcdF (DUF218 family)
MTRRALRRGALMPTGRTQSGGIISSLISLLFVVVLCLVLYLARHPLMRFAGEEWVVDDSLERADAIIVLSDDNFYADRAAHAADLYRHGMAPYIVASGRKLRPYAGIAELMEHDLVERAVPKDKILRVSHEAENTREEAVVLRPQIIDRKWRSVIVVTSNYHTRRTRYIFTHVFPPSVVVRVSAAKDGDFDPSAWWEKRVSIKRMATELVGMVVAVWEMWSGKGTKAPIPAVVGWNGLKLQVIV